MRKPASEAKTKEFVVKHKDGTVSDEELHAAMLEDDDADQVSHYFAVQAAIKDGMSPEDAEKFFGYKGPGRF